MNTSVGLLILVVALLLNLNGVQSKKLTPDQMRDMTKTLKTGCVKKAGVSNELVDNATNNGVFADDPALKCYYKCILSMLKAYRKDELRSDIMIQQVEVMVQEDLVDRMKEIILKCEGAVTSSDSCEISWQFVKCFYETDNSLYFLP